MIRNHSACVHAWLTLGPEHVAGFGDFCLFTGIGVFIRGLLKHCGPNQHDTIQRIDEIQAQNAAKWGIVTVMTAFSRRHR
jgi:hypothetical protein